MLKDDDYSVGIIHAASFFFRGLIKKLKIDLERILKYSKLIEPLTKRKQKLDALI